MSKVRAYLLPCGKRFRHERTRWFIEEPLERLDGWIAFYRKMAVKRPKIYGPDYAALRVLKAQVQS